MEINQAEIVDLEENSQMKQEAKDQAKIALERSKSESYISKQLKIFFD